MTDTNQRNDVKLFGDLFSLSAQTIFQSLNLKELNLTNLSIMTMMTIYSHSGISMSALASTIGVSNAQLSRTIAKLEADGLVERRHNEDNRRIVNVFHTQKGQQIANQQMTIIKTQLEGKLGSLTPTERAELSQHFIAIIALLAKAGIMKVDDPKVLDQAIFGKTLPGTHVLPDKGFC